VLYVLSFSLFVLSSVLPTLANVAGFGRLDHAGRVQQTYWSFLDLDDVNAVLNEPPELHAEDSDAIDVSDSFDSEMEEHPDGVILMQVALLTATVKSQDSDESGGGKRRAVGRPDEPAFVQMDVAVNGAEAYMATTGSTTSRQLRLWADDLRLEIDREQVASIRMGAVYEGMALVFSIKFVQPQCGADEPLVCPTRDNVAGLFAMNFYQRRSLTWTRFVQLERPRDLLVRGLDVDSDDTDGLTSWGDERML
jgi:hypothetical protein